MENQKIAPMLVGTIESMASMYKTNWNNAKAEVEKVISLYNETGLPALTGKDLHKLFNDTDNMLYDKMTGGEQAHLKIGKSDAGGHLPINRGRAMEMINKPVGYNALLESIRQCNKVCMAGFAPHSPCNVRFALSSIDAVFVIDNEGALQFSDSIKIELENAGKVYATTERGQAIYKFLQRIAEAFKELEMDKYLCNVPISDLDGSAIAGLIHEGMRSINLSTGAYVPVIHNTNTPFPKLYLDNDVIGHHSM